MDDIKKSEILFWIWLESVSNIFQNDANRFIFWCVIPFLKLYLGVLRYWQRNQSQAGRGLNISACWYVIEVWVYLLMHLPFDSFENLTHFLLLDLVKIIYNRVITGLLWVGLWTSTLHKMLYILRLNDYWFLLKMYFIRLPDYALSLYRRPQNIQWIAVVIFVLL